MDCARCLSMAIACRNWLWELSIDIHCGFIAYGQIYRYILSVTMDCGRYRSTDIVGNNWLVMIEIDRHCRTQRIVNRVHRWPLPATIIAWDIHVLSQLLRACSHCRVANSVDRPCPGIECSSRLNECKAEYPTHTSCVCSTWYFVSIKVKYFYLVYQVPGIYYSYE